MYVCVRRPLRCLEQQALNVGTFNEGTVISDLNGYVYCVESLNSFNCTLSLTLGHPSGRPTSSLPSLLHRNDVGGKTKRVTAPPLINGKGTCPVSHSYMIHFIYTVDL